MMMMMMVIIIIIIIIYCLVSGKESYNNIYLLQLGSYPVAVVILHVNKDEIGYY